MPILGARFLDFGGFTCFTSTNTDTYEGEKVWTLPILGARLLDFGGDEALFYVVFDSLFVVASIHDPSQVLAHQPPLAGDVVHAVRALWDGCGGESIELTKPV